MNKTTKILSGAAIGVITIAVTCAIFFLTGTNTGKTALDWISFAFVLLAEGLLLGSVLFLTAKPSPSSGTIIRAGILSSLSIYWVITAVLALFRNAFEHSPKGFLLIQVTLLAAVAIVSILLNMLAQKVVATDEKAKEEQWLTGNSKTGKRGEF